MLETTALPRKATLSPPLDTRYQVETPEGIDLPLRPAGLMVRALAFAIDLGLRGLIVGLLFIVLAFLGKLGAGLGSILLFVVSWWYMVLFEVLNQGRSPGKQWMGLRVVQDDGTPIGWSASLLRNLLRFVDMLPFGYFLGAISCLQHPTFKRLGDLAAGTLVIYREQPLTRPQLPDIQPRRPTFALTLIEQRAILGFAERQGELSEARVKELAAILAHPLQVSAPGAVDELNGIARGLLGPHMKQSLFESRHKAEWEQFTLVLEQLEHGKKAERVANFPSDYRRLCQHLALAQERGYSSFLIDSLQQQVLRGHQQLYRHRSRLGANVLGFILADFPRLVREQWRFVLAAGLMFFGSLIGFALLVYLFPDLVYNLIPAEQVSEMQGMYDPEAGHLGRSAERAASEDWVMFGYYIMHNIGIAFQTFASGLLFGLGSAFFLFFNGLMIGAVAGHLTHIGYGQTFWSFVVGHGAFELSAIALAGAAGLQLGWALIAPGRLPRSEALRLAARKSVLLICGVMLFLLIAAFIEAYWSSTVGVAPMTKYLVGAALWLLVAVYLLFAGRTRHAPE